MEFKKICINGISYGEVKEGDANYIKDITGFTEVTNVDFRDNQLVQALHDDSNAEKDNIMYHHYLANRKLLILLGLCHSIITETKDGKLLYNASSPDELALVNFARFLGCEYQGTDENNNITITWKGQTLQYQLFHILEFDSTRKRNSVIIKDLQNNQYKILTKGADSIIFDRSDPVKNGKEVPQR
jgi:phospholipid-transporting ATPase